MAELLSEFHAAVARHPDRVAIVDGRGRETTFAELKAAPTGWPVRLGLAWGETGDRVLLAMRLDADLYAALAALWSLGATVVLPEPAMGYRGLRHAARVTGASFLQFGRLRGAEIPSARIWGCRASATRRKAPVPRRTAAASGR
jgi:non-ribosomal peptide synthetase component F